VDSLNLTPFHNPLIQESYDLIEIVMTISKEC